jgi:hypothetical protein
MIMLRDFMAAKSTRWTWGADHTPPHVLVYGASRGPAKSASTKPAAAV